MLKKLLNRSACLGAGLMLAACGGGGGGSSAVELLNINGVAAAGQALSQARVELRCNTGTARGPASSDNSGIFRILLDGAQAPCMVAATGGTVAGSANTLALHGYASHAGIANATVLSELVLARALGRAPAAAFAGFGAAAPGPSAEALVQASAYVGDQFVALGLPRPTGDLLNGLFIVGDGNDQLIDRLVVLLAANGTDVAGLVEASAAGQPWPATVARRSCTADTLQWAEGSSSCSAGTTGASHEERVTLDNQFGSNLGQASFTCNNGRWGTADNAVCMPPPKQCAAQTAAWAVNGTGCRAELDATASGQSLDVIDAVAPATGSATFVCDNGSWGEPVAASCVAPAAPSPCAARTASWSVSGDICSAALAATGSGLSLKVIDALAPKVGSATFTCENGAWSEPGAATCAAPPPPSPCAAKTADWNVNGSSCSAMLAETASGQSLKVSDLMAPRVGSATFVCNSGIWSAPGAATCAAPAAPSACAARTASWNINGNSCSAALAETASGQSLKVTDGLVPRVGSATFACDDGTWSEPGAATCAAPAVRDCSAQAVTWQVSGKSCEGRLAQTASGIGALAVDNTLPTTGSATYDCTDGSWSPSGVATCSVPAQSACAAQTLDWSSGAASCSALVPTTASGTSIKLADVDGPATGGATFACNDGSWGAASGKSCSLPAACGATTLGWSVNGSRCSAAVPATDSGSSALAADNEGQATGSATFTCGNRTWGAASGASCSLPPGCSAQTLSWSVDGYSCSGAVPATASGNSAQASDTLGQATGAATFACSKGTWGAATSATCMAPPGCSGQTLGWSVNGKSCSAAVPATDSGGSVLASDTEGQATGSATFACNTGAWSAASSASCSLPPDCSAQTLGWSVNGNSCSAAVPATASGGSALAVDTVGQATGSASFACTKGAWGSATAATCTVPESCAAQVLSWSAGTNSCSASVSSTASGGSVVARDDALPTIGTASFACSNGTWGGASNPLCASPPQGAQSITLDLQADNGGRWYDNFSDAFGEIGKAWNGSATLDGFFAASQLPNHVTIGTGQDIFPKGGAWKAVGSVTFNLDGYKGVGSFNAPITSMTLNLAPYVAENASVLDRPYATAISGPSGQVTLQDGVVTAITLTSTVTFSWLATPLGDLLIPGEFAITSEGRFVLRAGTDAGAAARWDFGGRVDLTGR